MSSRIKLEIKSQNESISNHSNKKVKSWKSANENISNKKATVFDIQRFSIHDGPGIRTTVFLKGCNLNCKWCHNPESISSSYELYWDVNNCVNCRRCAAVCKENVHLFNFDKNNNVDANNSDIKHVVVRSRCNFCKRCEEVCPAQAIKVVGNSITINDLILMVLRDELFYKNSGGGVTISGGEPFCQYEFLLDFLKILKKKNINTAVDTSFYIDWKKIQAVMPYVDLFLVDLKTINDDNHIKFTGVSNKLILDNIRKFSETEKDFWLRVPIIPGVNDFSSEINNIISFVKTIKNCNKIQLLPFHQAGKHKYKCLGLDYEFLNYSAIDNDEMEKIKSVFEKNDISVKVGSL